MTIKEAFNKIEKETGISNLYKCTVCGEEDCCVCNSKFTNVANLKLASEEQIKKAFEELSVLIEESKYDLEKQFFTTALVLKYIYNCNIDLKNKDIFEHKCSYCGSVLNCKYANTLGKLCFKLSKENIIRITDYMCKYYTPLL